MSASKNSDPTSQLRELLETEPLLRRVVITSQVPSIAPPDSITLRCPTCSTEPSTTWTRADLSGWPIDFDDTRAERARADGRRIDSRTTLVRYTCARCNARDADFWIEMEGDFSKAPSRLGGPSGEPASQATEREFKVRKLGQRPPWSITVTPEAEKALGPKAFGYLRGAKTCIASGFGIGAVAYLRRVIEDDVDKLLEIVETAAKNEGDADKLARIQAARATKPAADRLKLAAEAVPNLLRRGNVNPLSVLYGAFSDGLHSKTDDECIVIANDWIQMIEFIFITMKSFNDQLAAVGKTLARQRGE